MSLRERKKQRTHEAISNAAIALFTDRGFDRVSITEIAEAAEVSRRTLFAYFRTKEDLVIHRFSDHETEAGDVVRTRPEGQSPLAALRAHFLDGLRRRDPITGLNDVPEILALYRMIFDTPSLTARILQFNEGAEHALARELTGTNGFPPRIARLAAAQIVAVQWTLARDNHEMIAEGMSAEDAYPAAVAAAELGFSLLETGLPAGSGKAPQV
ncbi:TetR/AcrR family transcriptional regulator [Amycolatopsis taiwanensis]|uniref:TetR/AcrR family transcriptional regulator n=1 Tax=Amycolatopsis taiwanensis TaxID=342230 RepID=UPI0004802636|nr:TetR family transcriptional regulator [Amycolatopsis taiwanensis]